MIIIKFNRFLLLIALSMLVIPVVHAGVYDCPGGDCPPNLSAFPATAGIPTGMIKFGSTSGFIAPSSATIDWGDGLSSSALMECTVAPITTKVTCDYWGHQHTYANHGLYKIVVTNNVGGSTAPFSLPVVDLGNFVIVSLGDSVASGEGNPVVPSQNGHKAYWDYGDTSTKPSSNGCHGSMTSGPGIAARTIITDNPSTRVTFIHQACSGAKIGTGLDSEGAVPETATGQLNGLMKLLPPDTKIDVLLVSAGANNVLGGFGNVINTCLGPYPGNSIYAETTPDPSLNCRTDTQQQSVELRDALSTIPTLNYDPLAALINNSTLNVSNTEVYITNYFDPTHSNTGFFPNSAETLACSGNLLLTDEWNFLYYNMVVPLNNRIKQVADQFGWHRVGGIAADFLEHGYCVGSSGERWVVSFPESITTQGDYSGTAHPNNLGHKNYATHIVEAINTWTLPITSATAMTDSGAYTFDTWSHEDVAVTLSAANKLVTAGVGTTKFSVDDEVCSDAAPESCSDNSDPVTVSASGTHTLYFLSSNEHDKFENVKTVQVKIDKPVAYDDTINTTVDNAISAQLTALNPDSSDTLIFSIVTQAGHGTVTLDDASTGSFTYIPAEGYVGDDSFTFMLNNGYVDSNIATESVSVTAVTTSDGPNSPGALGPWGLCALAILAVLARPARRRLPNH